MSLRMGCFLLSTLHSKPGARRRHMPCTHVLWTRYFLQRRMMMHQKLCSRSLLLAGGLAAAVAAGACTRDNVADNRAPGSAAGADANQTAAITIVTGCLQKGSGGSDYILTEAVVPTPVGTSGSAAEPNKAARDQ